MSLSPSEAHERFPRQITPNNALQPTCERRTRLSADGIMLRWQQLQFEESLDWWFWTPPTRCSWFVTMSIERIDQDPFGPRRVVNSSPESSRGTRR